jgi:hypothetical protein
VHRVSIQQHIESRASTVSEKRTFDQYVFELFARDDGHGLVDHRLAFGAVLVHQDSLVGLHCVVGFAE